MHPTWEHLKNIKQILMDIKEEIDSNTAIVGDFTIPLTSMTSSSRQKINKETSVLSDTLDQVDLMISLEHFTPNIRIYILFKYTWNIF